MIVTGLPMLEVKKEEGVVAYDPPLSASLKDVSSNVERVSSFDFCRTATSPVSNAAVHKLQGAKLWLQPIALIESLPRDSDLHRFGPSWNQAKRLRVYPASWYVYNSRERRGSVRFNSLDDYGYEDQSMLPCCQRGTFRTPGRLRV